MVVAVNRVDIPGGVYGGINELVTIADGESRVDIDRVIGESAPAITGNAHPYGVIAASSGGAASYLGGAGNATKDLIEIVVGGVDHQVAGGIIVNEVSVSGINGISQLGKGQP